MNNRFMIGQFGYYNKIKQKRDFRKGFYGVEACLIEKLSDIEKLVDESRKHNYRIGVHFPLRTDGWRFRDPQFLSLDEVTMRTCYDYIKDEITFLELIQPEYILFHYPKPVILNETVDWTNWRFADETEFYMESKYSYEDFKSKSERFFAWIEMMSIQHNFLPVIELDALNRYVYDTDLLQNLLIKYPKVKLCLDIGRLHLQDELDNNFNALEFTKRYAKYAYIIHLWNVKVTTNFENSHYPALPELNPSDGWADIETYLKTINKENKTYKILFEHRSDLITEEQLNNCYNWIDELI